MSEGDKQRLARIDTRDNQLTLVIPGESPAPSLVVKSMTSSPLGSTEAAAAAAESDSCSLLRALSLLSVEATSKACPK